MRRRLDIAPLPFMQPDGAMYQVTSNGVLVPFVQDDTFDPEGGQELGSMPQSYLSFTQDYVSRARYLAGSQQGNGLESVGGVISAADVRKSITKLERAVLELRAGMLGKSIPPPFSQCIDLDGTGDEDSERKTQAEVLLNAYSRELERRRLAAGADGLFRIEGYSNFN